MDPAYTELVRFLRTSGYLEVDHLHGTGEFMVRGDTVLIWPAGSAAQYRLHYFGETLEKAECLVEDQWQPAELPTIPPNQLITEHGSIRPGEYIVHPYHGVGIFEGITVRTVEGEVKQFISLQYAGNDRLLFPLDNQAELMPYIGSRHPRLTRLYSKAWQHTKERVQKNLIQVARDLLKVFAARQLNARTPLHPAVEWERLLDDSVPFNLTDDQARAMRDIRYDFEQVPLPMDRLICGDVGFGKTEVALRAAAQVIANGKQVAFLAPTTVLVEQHFALLKQRFSVLPVTVEHLSRVTSANEKEVLQGLLAGTVDLVVGTHRILGKDVVFKNLGLVIVDEEQKFGVVQKERLKKLRPHIDVISLSATPIPRTLSMSLSGLRGLSLLRTAPQGRLPIRTEVLPASDESLQNALAQELQRGGQTYVVYNRVQSLPAIEQKVRLLATQAGYPEARITTVHGQMGEMLLAQRMSGFLAGEYDILVASSIVEHGLDSPKANTLVVLHSEWFGLSDLYQLRGRVGRRDTQAYAYFMTTQEVSPVARQRLNALLEADVLGSGWSIALRDLEIRGGGNILGTEQSGSMEAIGLLLYAQLLQEEVGRQAHKLGIQLFQKNEELPYD